MGPTFKCQSVQRELLPVSLNKPLNTFFVLGVGTKIEPTLCRADRLVGQVLGAVGALPKIFIELEISYYLLKRLLGVRTEGDKKGAKVFSSVSAVCGFW